MARLLVGSAAHTALFGRNAPDEDWIATPEEIPNLLKGCVEQYPLNGDKYLGKRLDGRMIEVEVAWPETTGEALISLAYEHGLTSCGEHATPGILLALKLSHRFKASPHFLKTMYDIKLLRRKGVVVPSVLHDWLRRRERETLAYHVHPKLNQSSMGFFRPEEVPYQYVHDTIHLAMAVGSRPAYFAFQADGAEVKVDKSKWKALSFDQQLHSVLEESYVLALERHQIPNNFTPFPIDSFLIALQKVCTTIASGWWREWAWEHYEDAVAAFDPGYVGKFQAAVKAGVVKPFVKEGAHGV